MAIPANLVALTLAAAFLATASSAAADPLPPTPPLPGLPAPPATLGRCIQAGQDGLNGGTAALSETRNRGLLAVEHQRVASTAAFSATTDAAMPEAGPLIDTYDRLVQASNASAGPLAALPVLMASSVGPAANHSINGVSVAISDALPATVVQFDETLPWIGDRSRGALDPLVEWNRHTTYSMLLDLGGQAAFFSGYGQGQAGGSRPPLDPTYGALASLTGGAGEALAAAALLGDGASAASDAMLQGTLGLLGAGDPAHGMALNITGGTVAAAQAGVGTMVAMARSDGLAVADAGQAGAAAAAAQGQALPGRAVSCPGT